MRAELDEVAIRLGTTRESVEEVLAVLQGFDPVGVAARDLAECLALQLHAKDRLDPAMSAFLTRLDLVARRETAALCAICGVDAADIADMVREIRELTAQARPRFRIGAGTAGHSRRLRERRSRRRLAYRTQHRHAAAPARQCALLQQGLGRRARQGFEDLPRRMPHQRQLACEEPGQRARTILKVASEIVRQQDGFLTYGVRHLRPLNLRTIADAISMHESTVSRVTSNKYIATPRAFSS